MEVVQTMSIMEKAVLLMGSELFQNIPTDEAALIAAKTMEVRFEPGEIINQDPVHATSFLLIIEGVVEHYQENVVVRRAKKGAATGLMGLMGVDEPDSHTIRVAEPTHTIALAREDFIDAVADHPDFAIQIMRGLAKHILVITKRIEDLERKAGPDPGSP